MSAGKPFAHKNIFKIIIAGWLVLGAASCTIIKHYQPGKPFVYKTNINLEGEFSKAERESFKSRLKDQLDDSLKARSVTKFGINFRSPVIFFWNEMKSPPLFDSANADKSILSMEALLRSLGYFTDSIRYNDTIMIVDKDQYRTIIDFNVSPGKQVMLDSIKYNLRDSGLQTITDAHLKEAFIKKGDPFAKAPISLELDRLVDLYRNNGYLRFTKDELKGYWDTLNLALLDPSLDPFEQIALLDSIKKIRVNPKANLEIRLRPGFDSSKLNKYYIGDIYVYPDNNQDTIRHPRQETIVDGVRVIYHRKIFKPKILPPNIYFRRGDLYNQSNYFKTINRFNTLNTWSLINIDTARRQGNSDTVDFHIRLTPARKYSFTTNLEGSRNQSAISGNLFGVALNFGLQNRNFAKAANQTNTNVRYGIELSDTGFIQTKQFIVSHTIYFPRPIPNSNLIPEKWRENFRTVFSFSVGNTERRDYFNLTTLNGSWGYDFQIKKKLITIRVPNIEYSYLKQRALLKQLIDSTPALKNIFTDGFIASGIASLTVSGGRNKNLNIFRANMEEAGLLTGLIHSKFLDTNLYRFIKIDGEFTRKIQYNKSAIALRFFAGIGWEFNSTVNPLKRDNLPFFKQYFAGGPNSMRAWGLRRLGPGSLIEKFLGSDGIPERYGDIQLESNIEYRFPITSISSVSLNGALFTDIGNVWLLKKSANRLPEEIFSFSRLGKDLAVGAGAGLRIDFSFFVIRLDYAYKVKDPSPRPEDAAIQNKWFGYKFFKGDQFQLGVRYPFIL